jgi:threonine 3-dehydrogenase
MSDTMQAVVKTKAAPGAEIREVKVPAFGRNDVLVKVKVASICGTDLHIYEWDRWAQKRIHPPLIPGHEFCGEVAAFGDEVTSVKEGDFVSAEMHVACGKCLQCRTGEAHICQNVKIIGVDADGAFAEYVVQSQISGSSIPPSRRSTLPSSIRWATRFIPYWRARSPPKP